jgi:hypothetical protein
MRYRFSYVEGLRVAQEPQPLRFGTAWHKGLEVLATPTGTNYSMASVVPVGAFSVTITDENRLKCAIEEATFLYTTIPDWADLTEWAVEQEIVANALAAYHWLYPSEKSEYETVAVELQFDLPLVNPETSRATSNFRRVGKIDRIVRHKGTGRLLIQENKSTSKTIDSGSTYWQRLRKDTQSKFYIVAARDLQADGIHDDLCGDTISGLLHDVFHKPQIGPKKLTQAESAEFVKTGEYCGQKFDIVRDPVRCLEYVIDGVAVDFEWGAEPKAKKDGTVASRPFAIRETPGMFGARLFADMTGQTDLYKDAHGPAHYFARHEVAFTDQELEDFRYQVWALQRTMAEMERTGLWYENEQQCEATFRCEYCPLCYNNVQCCDGVTVPPGFKRTRVINV